MDFATAPALGSDGRLLQSNVFDRAGPDDVRDNDIPAGQCRGYVRSELPRVVYWQAWRTCIDCGGYETSEVRSMRLTTAGAGLQVTARWPRRAYAGYPFHVSVASTGVGAFTTLVADAFLPRTRIAPDGTFAWAGTIKGHAMYIHGKVRGKRSRGAVRMSLRTCTGGSKWTARQR